MKKLFLTLLAIVALMMASTMPSQAFDTFSYTVLTLPDDPRIDEPWLKVIHDQDDWESHFYATTAAVTYLEGTAPVATVFDFEEYQVISGGLGFRSNGGYYLAVASVNELEEVLLIHVLDISAGSTCLTTAAITHPSMTLLVKKTDKPIKISVTELTDQCPEF